MARRKPQCQEESAFGGDAGSIPAWVLLPIVQWIGRLLPKLQMEVWFFLGRPSWQNHKNVVYFCMHKNAKNTQIPFSEYAPTSRKSQYVWPSDRVLLDMATKMSTQRIAEALGNVSGPSVYYRLKRITDSPIFSEGRTKFINRSRCLRSN